MKKPTFRSLKNKLDKVFSEWIRRRHATSKGDAVCVSCHAVKPWKQMQAGHYVSRVHLATRWDDRNAHVQCGSCNVLRRGNYSEYTEFMLRKYGPGIIEDLNRKKRAMVKYTISDLESFIEDYKVRLAAL